MRWFEASLRRATPKGQDPSSPAQHRIKDPSYIGPSLRSGHTSAPTACSHPASTAPARGPMSIMGGLLWLAGARPPGQAPPGDEVAAERVGRCLLRLRQRLRVRFRVRYWLRLGFRRRQWPRLRPGFRRRWRRHWRRYWRRPDRFGPRRLRLRGLRLRCLTSIWSGVWRHLAWHFAVGHRGLTG